ncbi:MAG: Ig-like domain-containing protein [Saccharofermentans sp.]|nr:Ig-like domain-containing protein [Saccharofermentans sp.]
MGALVSAAVMFSMIPGMAMAADATAVDAMVTSDVTYNNPVTIEGITISSDTNNNNSRIRKGQTSTRFEVPNGSDGTFSFAINERGAYAGYSITKIEIAMGTVTNVSLPEASNPGWGTLTANSTLTWAGTPASSVSLTLHGDKVNYGNHRAIFTDITVYVQQIVPVSSITVAADGGATISQTAATVYVGDPLTLTAEPSNAADVRAEDYTITWSSDNEEVATVANGVVTLKAAGNATITATITDNVASTSYTAQCALEVDQHLDGIAVTPSTLNLIVDSSSTLTVTYDPTVYDDTISSPLFESDNPEVASVNYETGLVEARKEGTATITVTVYDYTTDEMYSATCTVTVVEVEPVAMYRLYNPNSGDHFYTADDAEAENLINLGWNDEGIGWIAPIVSDTPVYRQYNPNEFANNHNYTTDETEKDNLISLGWLDENIGWYGLSPLQEAT